MAFRELRSSIPSSVAGGKLAFAKLINPHAVMTIREHPDVSAFKLAASRFCELLERRPSDIDEWVADVLESVSKVYAYGHSLPEFSLEVDAHIPDDFDVDDDEWKHVYGVVQGGSAGFLLVLFRPE